MPMIAVLAEIVEAFKAVFPNELVRSVEYTVEYDIENERDKEIFAIKSDKIVGSVPPSTLMQPMTRRYFRSDPTRPFANILRETPELE